ncbi:MAG TPA: RagB/SusD family nutrient uptake outer membrane protein, partial [Bacteroidales bacterium]|nr:RagB/SusD family nutrient uptake outer membrane protein [Bacteroidales bacterium]
GDPNKGWGFNRPSIALINSFEPGDKRKLGTVIFLGETIDGILINGDPATADTTWTDATHTTIAEFETYNRKVWTPGTTTVEEWGYNIREIRYSDVLLIAAEALNEIGKSDSALIFLNEVRDRAGVAEETSVDQSVLRDKIFNERHLEFAMEGQRFFDLVRTGRATQVLGPYGFIPGKNELLPIPESEIELSGGTLTQNPNWH